jgi:hypothetical protein
MNQLLILDLYLDSLNSTHTQYVESITFEKLPQNENTQKTKWGEGVLAVIKTEKNGLLFSLLKKRGEKLDDT